MPLTPGTRLGPYEIQAPLGAGGMGEVYRARDARLGREVAVKVLPQHLSSNPEVRTRFEREAKTVSGLNHPSICVLHDVGREGDTDFLVMELLEGETLAQRLSRGALPLAEVLKVGGQIADALDRAHGAGVVHRDLKPGNVMLTKAGAKLMDFGLARATGLAGPATGSGATMAALTQSPTMASPLTAEGTIVGTFQYMAPEQLEGREADSRTDLWAFGCLLYEMATGRRAFEGASQASLIASILKEEPRPVSEVSPIAPPALDRLVRACLAKDPAARLQSAHDARLQLEWIAEGGGASMARRRPSRAGLGWIVAAALAVAVAVLALVPRSAQLPGQGRVTRVSVLPPEGAVIDNEALHTAVAPNGAAIVFVATDTTGTSQLWLRNLEDPEPRPLARTEGAILPFWSPDSRSIGFFAGGKLRRMDTEGQNVQILCDAPDGRGGAWSTRGVILFAPASESPLFQVPEAGGRPVQVTRLDSTRHEIAHRFPCFLPGERSFLFASLTTGDTLQTRRGQLGSTTTTPVLTSDFSGAVYAPPGYLVFARNEALMAQRLDPGRGRLTGEPRVLGGALSNASRYNGAPPASVSTNGVLVQRVRRPRLSRLAWLDREGRRSGVVAVAAAQYNSLRLSPDDQHAALTRISPETGSDVWAIDLPRAIATRLTVDRPFTESPTWTPDGRWITFAWQGSRGRFLSRVLGNGAGDVEDLQRLRGTFDNPASWSPDGRILLLRTLSPVTGEDAWAIPGGTDTTWAPVLGGRHHEENPTFSPDGRWIAYRSDESGRTELYVQSFPVPDTRLRVSREGAGQQVRSSFGQPFWRRDGRELIYVAGDGATVMSASVETAGGLHVGAARPLFRIPPECSDLVATSDTQRFLVLEEVASKEGASIQMVIGWPWLFAKR